MYTSDMMFGWLASCQCAAHGHGNAAVCRTSETEELEIEKASIKGCFCVQMLMELLRKKNKDYTRRSATACV